MNILEIGDSISWRIRDARERAGFSIIELARYLHKRWSVGVPNAMNYIHDLEKNLFTRFGNRMPYNALEVHEMRIADYLASLGNMGKKAENILHGIEQIRQEFRYVSSNVEAYKKPEINNL